MEEKPMLHMQARARQIDVLELHISHSCNLKCQHCTHYSNYSHKGMLDASTADLWISQWAPRVSPGRFSIMGGEPTLNPELCDILRISRKHFFNNSMHLISNGFFLDRHPGLDQVLYDNDILLKISLHAEPDRFEEYDNKIKEVEEMLSTWKCRWKFTPSHKKWRRLYNGYGSDMKPFNDGNPRASWECCFQRTCHQLHEGMIWKCPSIAYLRMQYEKYNLGPEWDQYLDYQALKPDCTEKELEAFFAKEEESICSMCPASIQYTDKGNPLVQITA